MLQRFNTIVACLITAGLLGCDDANRVEIQGSVTYDGVAVEKGTISLSSLEADSSSDAVSDAGEIENGRYALETSLGKKRVEIRASRPLPPERQNNPEMGLLYEDFIPPSYNRESTLTVDITEDGQRDFDFDLATP